MAVAVNEPAVNVPTPIIFTTPSMSPPLPDAEKLVAVNVPPTTNPPPIPTPPATCNAPVVVLLVGVVFAILITLVVVCPRLVTVCSVLVFHITTDPVAVLTAVSVPAVTLVAAY